MFRILILIMSFGLTQQIQAAQGLIGTWKLEQNKCSNGVSPSVFDSSQALSYTIQYKILSQILLVTLDIKSNFPAEQFQALAEQLQEYKVTLEKPSEIEQVNKAIAWSEFFGAGKTCQNIFRLDYTIKDSQISTTSMIKISDTCPTSNLGGTNYSGLNQNFELSADQQKLIFKKTNEKACSGGTLISEFVRQK